MQTARLISISGAFLGFSISVVSGVACSSAHAPASDGKPPADVAHAPSDSPGTATGTATDIAALVADNNAYAFDTYARIRGTSGNLSFAPYSISVALAMTYAGARGETATQMASALHFSLPQERLHPAFEALDEALIKNAGTSLALANSLWGARNLVVEPSFQNVLTQDYGSGLQTADFATAPEDARAAINAWVSDATRGHLPSLLPGGSITGQTLFVLVNAVDFHAAWEYAFDPAQTTKGPFYAAAGAEQVDMMKQSGPFAMDRDEAATVVELPYQASTLALTMVMPKPGTLDAFEATLTAASFADRVSKLKGGRTDLTIPKLSLGGSALSLKAILMAQGMVAAFGEGADFGGISAAAPQISDVFHAARVSWDEAGAEASGATGVVGSNQEYFPTVVVSSPFLYFLRDTKTGAILFAGRVVTTQ